MSMQVKLCCFEEESWVLRLKPKLHAGTARRQEIAKELHDHCLKLRIQRLRKRNFRCCHILL